MIGFLVMVWCMVARVWVRVIIIVVAALGLLMSS